MFFVISKLAWIILAPGNVIALFLALGIILTPILKKTAHFLLLIGSLLLIILGLLPIGYNSLVYLETQYNTPELPQHVDGFIILGGSFESDLSNLYKTPQINSSSDRLYQAAKLSYIYKDSIFLFTGRYGGLNQVLAQSISSDEAQQFFKDVGYENINLIVEDKSRNTYENAAYSFKKIRPKPDEIWVLITSAYHMRRAYQSFMSVGWQVIPYPVDFQTEGKYKWSIVDMFVLKNLNRCELAFREIIGLLAYKLSGKIKTSSS